MTSELLQAMREHCEAQEAQKRKAEQEGEREAFAVLRPRELEREPEPEPEPEVGDRDGSVCEEADGAVDARRRTVESEEDSEGCSEYDDYSYDEDDNDEDEDEVEDGRGFVRARGAGHGAASRRVGATTKHACGME